jgi:large subunit ribosomal protein L23
MINIIIAPVVSEKAIKNSTTLNTYHFRVQNDANKIEIKRAIEKRFSVEVKSVKTVQVIGKSKAQINRKARQVGKQADWKKAIVRLKDGHKLDFYGTPNAQ